MHYGRWWCWWWWCVCVSTPCIPEALRVHIPPFRPFDSHFRFIRGLGGAHIVFHRMVLGVLWLQPGVLGEAGYYYVGYHIKSVSLQDVLVVLSTYRIVRK